MSQIARGDLFPPGEYIRDELEARNWTQEDLASILEKPLKSVSQIITGKKAITPKTAHALAAAFGTSAELWMNLESAYRLGLEAENQEEVARRSRLFDVAPVNELLRRKWIRPADTVDELERSILRFLGTPSIDVPPTLDDTVPDRHPEDALTAAQVAWVLRVRELAAAAPAAKWDRAAAIAKLHSLHELTSSTEEIGKVPLVLAEMGIRFVLVEPLRGTKIDGVAMWTKDGDPVIGISLRYDRIDGFWHTLAHEISHILHGDGFSLDIDLIGKGHVGADGTDAKELRADREAAAFLIPPDKLSSFVDIHRPRFSKAKILQFATTLQIHPGIVVGQLQRAQAMMYTHGREMLVGIGDILKSTALTDGWHAYPGF